MTPAGGSVRDLVKQAKYYSSIAVDLALYSLASGSRVAALEALRIERIVDGIVGDLIARASLAVRSPDESGLAVSIAGVAMAFDKITDAAGDLAGLVIRGYPVHDYVRGAVNCCGEVIRLIRSSRDMESIEANVDVLLVRRGDTYHLAPETRGIREGDLVVVRGTPEEVAEVARLLEEPGERAPFREPALLAALAGDELASSLIKMRTLARHMLDLSFHALIYSDASLARLVPELEDEVDTLYHEVLEDSYAASHPSLAREMVSIAIFADAVETLADAATIIARIASDKRLEEYSEFLGEAVEEAEEGYARLEATEALDGVPLASLRLPRQGVTVLAVKNGDRWIVPVPQDYRLRRGDIVLVKYYKEAGEEEDEEVLSALERAGFRVLEE